MRFISRFGRFYEDFSFTLPFTPSLSIPFTSKSIPPLSLPLSLSLFFYLSLSIFISYLSLPLFISPSTFLSLSLLSIIIFGVSNGCFRLFFYYYVFLLVENMKRNLSKIHHFDKFWKKYYLNDPNILYLGLTCPQALIYCNNLQVGFILNGEGHVFF